MNRLFTLQGASWLFIATWLVHSVDHMRRGLDASSEAVIWGGTLAALLAAVSITLVFARHDIAPAVATAVFPAIAIGVSATHLLPEWGVLSDPIIVDSTTDGWSIVAVVPEIVAAAVLGGVGLRLMSQHGYRLRIPSPAWG